MPKFQEENIKVWKHISDEVCEEVVLHFSEDQIHNVHKVMKFMIKGKNQQLKEYNQKLKKEKLKQK
jgi:hypothetical protein